MTPRGKMASRFNWRSTPVLLFLLIQSAIPATAIAQTPNPPTISKTGARDHETIGRSKRPGTGMTVSIIAPMTSEKHRIGRNPRFIQSIPQASSPASGTSNSRVFRKTKVSRPLDVFFSTKKENTTTVKDFAPTNPAKLTPSGW